MGQVDPRLLEILACPACHGDVKEEGDRIVCQSCGRRYPIRDGIPIMLVEEAEMPEGGGQGEGESEAEGGEAGTDEGQ